MLNQTICIFALIEEIKFRQFMEVTEIVVTLDPIVILAAFSIDVNA